jgi:hypothetical protein
MKVLRSQLLQLPRLQRCVIFPFSNTKDALCFRKSSCSVLFFDQSGREAGAFLVRKIKPPEDFTSDN